MKNKTYYNNNHELKIRLSPLYLIKMLKNKNLYKFLFISLKINNSELMNSLNKLDVF